MKKSIKTKKILERYKNGNIKKYVYLINGKEIPKGKRYCPGCDTIKDKETEYSSAGTSCRECANKRARKHHKRRMKDPQYVKERRIHYRMRGRRMKRQIVEYLGRECSECKGVFPDSVYDLHHTDPKTKVGNLSDWLKYGWERVKEELKKCVLLCANCHRIKTYPDVID